MDSKSHTTFPQADAVLWDRVCMMDQANGEATSTCGLDPNEFHAYQQELFEEEPPLCALSQPSTAVMRETWCSGAMSFSPSEQIQQNPQTSRSMSFRSHDSISTFAHAYDWQAYCGLSQITDDLDCDDIHYGYYERTYTSDVSKSPLTPSLTVKDTTSKSSVYDTSDKSLIIVRCECGLVLKGDHAKGNLTRHRKSRVCTAYAETRQCICPYCNQVFRRSDALLVHARKRHGGAPPKRAQTSISYEYRP